MTLTKIKTAALENVIRIHGNTENQKPTEVIDLNIKTNLTVSNTKESKFVQKSLFLLVLFFTGTFTILLCNVRRELQALKSQEQCVETKIAMLMTKYEKVNNQLNRIRSHMHYHKYYQPLTTSKESEEDSIISAFNSKVENAARYKRLNTAEFVISQNDQANAIVGTEDKPNLISESNSQENSSFIPKDDFRDAAVSEKDSKINFAEDNNRSKSGNRFTRTILNSTDENYQTDVRTVNQNSTDTGPSSNFARQNDQLPNIEDQDYSIDQWSEPRTARMRRDDERRGPLVATFIGGIPEQHITDRGSAIGPWIKLTKNTSLYDLQKFHLVDNKKAIEITMNGLYMISTQIFYFGQQTNYSYWILLNSEGQSTTQRVTKCSAVTSVGANEVSCHTNVVLPLRRGDRLHIQQQERDRLVNLREGHSYVQLVLLSNESQTKKQVT